MAAPIEFYFDFSSPYGYFASTRIDALAAGFGRETRWRPILLGPMFKQMGSAPLVDIPLKGAYAAHDFVRTAKMFGIPFTYPKPFPIATVGAARAMLWIEKNYSQATAKRFAQQIFQAYFVDQSDISQMPAIQAAAAAAAVSPEKLTEGIQDIGIKNALKDHIDEAIQRGVFGSPFIFVDNEPFWGFDRFDYIRKWLQGR